MKQLAWLAVIAALAGCGQDATNAPPARKPAPVVHDAPVARPGPQASVVAAEPAPPASGPKLPNGPPEVVARVLGQDGKPLAGARVIAAGMRGVRAEAVTDSNGRAQVPGPRKEYWFARAEKDGLVSAWVRIESASGWPPPDLSLVEATSLCGVVLDAKSGAPVAGVHVDIAQGGSVTETWTERASGDASFGGFETGADGCFGPAVVPRGIVVTAEASVPGRPNEERTVLVPRAGEPDRVEIRMENGGFVTAHVLRPDGSPAAGAHVWVSSSSDGDPSWTDAGSPPAFLDRSPGIGADADFREDGLRLGAKYYARAHATGWAASTAVPFSLTDEQPSAAVELRLRRPATLDVRVVDPDGHAVDAAEIDEVHDRGMVLDIRKPQPRAQHGHARLEGLTPGEMTIEVQAPGFPATRRLVPIAEGEAREEIVRLERPVSIRGRVVDDRGQSIAGVSMGAQAQSRDSFDSDDDQQASRETAADGSFEIRGLAPGRYRVYATEANHVRGEPVIEDAPADEVVVRLVRRGKVRFRLRPPAGVAPPTEVASGTGALVSNWDGDAYTIPYLDPGDHSFELFPEGFAEVTIAFRIAPGETTDLGDVSIEVGETLRSRIVDPQGRPVPRTVVSLVERRSRSDTADDDGRFELAHLAKTDNVLELRREGFLVERVTVRGDVQTPSIVLHRGGLVRIRLVDASGQPCITNCAEVFPTDAKEPPRIYTDERRRGEGRLPAGKHELRVHGADPVEIDVIEGGELDVTIRQR